MVVKKIKNDLIGFTLIELLVSVSIITILTGVFLTNYHSTNKRSEINMIAQKMLSDIHLVQSKSLSLAEYGASNIPLGGWGIHLVNGESEYIIFADNNGDNMYNIGEAEEAKGAKTINMGNVSINNINLAEILDIVFLPPNPKVYFNGTLGEEAIISLSDSESEKKININFLGVVDIED
jgi:prepilin-type N-terminal cleavage/methylation domain-containing protein